VPDNRSEQDRRSRDTPSLGAALRQAWVGYQLRLDEEMTAAGFADRSLPNGRVLRLCARSEDVTASKIGRELGISRQGAGKVVAGLHSRGYVTLRASSGDRREKVLVLTEKGRQYLAAQRSAARKVERAMRRQIGAEAFDDLCAALDVLRRPDQPRLREYLRQSLDRARELE
jgi:MarR family transcriptional regulator, organic hydroperoxide resistance regulator